MTGTDTVPRTTLGWMEAGTSLLFERVTALGDAELDGPTRLPGWTRRHLLAHIGANAHALGRLAHWARTGERTPMYAGPEARTEEIEQGAALGSRELRAFVRDSASELSGDLRSLPDDRWGAEVTTAQGRTVPARVIPWMRCREVWVHAVDLDNGAAFGDFPPDLLDALISDVTGEWTRRGQGPALVLRPEDRDREWPVETGDRPAVAVTGRAADLASWLTGRGAGGVRPAEEAAPLPALGRWL
ncbi:maleylpyruvate isomerase family mycothiol-dependent enzyme [Allosalinactinospora lopnorensis]|uniref:maleylpyruvate isomerase family mycothiol-dependent enzyme n=1 Tax=Allosalinactinospora lopnorensis TaxID=1352348 RepID=UPI000695D62A|nr:maleylpyruvate isomerase family mycothiol-dependent enzyme [Allosalinactinospora lopnorensis]